MTIEIGSSASARIRRFSVVVWVVGVLLVGVVAVVTIYLRFTEDERWFQQFPWNQAEPVVATLAADSETWSAAGSAFVPVPDDLLAEGPLLLEFVGGKDGGWLTPAYTPAGKSATTDTQVLDMVDSYSPKTFVVAERGGKVWVHAERPWQLRIVPLQYEEIQGDVQGAGPVFLRYRGGAGAATITIEDRFADLTVASGTARDHIFFEQEKTHFSWEPGADVLFWLKAEPDARWSIVLHEVTGSASSAETDGEAAAGGSS